MKLGISVLALLVASAAQLHAQAEVAATGVGLTYRFDAAVPVVECRLDGSNMQSAVVQAPPYSQFVFLGNRQGRAVGATDPVTVAVIQFLAWNDTTQLYRTFNADPADPIRQRKTFCVAQSHFQELTTRTYDWGPSSWDLAAGVLLLPIKMRLGGSKRPFDFSRDVTIGTVMGVRWRTSPTREAYLSLLGGAGISAVTLNAENTGGKVAESTDRAAVTLAAGLMVEINRFQFGLMMGTDRISNPNQSDWVYHGKRWLSIGLGYSLLNAPAEAPAENGQPSNK